MPTIVSNNEVKKVPNVKPLNASPLNKIQFSNIIFPFGRTFGPKIFGELAQKLSHYSPNNNGIKIPVPGEGLPRVINYCADQSGCAFWRMIWPGDELLANNKAVIMTLYQMVTLGQFYGGIDAVRLQRQCTEPQLEFIKFLRNVSDQMKQQTGKGFRIIWEVDDIVCPAVDIPDYNVCKTAFEGDTVYNNVKEMMKYVDEATVVSEHMRQHYKKHLGFDKITVIPNYAPKSWIDRGYDEKQLRRKYNRKGKPRVLYAGSGTHFDVTNRTGQKDDFGHVVDSIIKDITIDKKYDWVFFGALPMKLKQFIGKGIEFHPWCSILDYPQKLREMDVDVSIAPLQNNAFSRSKANIKLTEAGMQGIPCVAQNIDCYNSDGWKYLFDTAEEMFKKVDQILRTETSYMEACKFAREYSEKFLLQDHLDEYTLLYTTDYGDIKRKENASFLKNNPEQFV
jgi:hypothetical protein